MSFLRLAWRNIWRKPARTLLTAASVFFGMLLLCILLAAIAMWTGGASGSSSKLRLVVRSRTSLANPLPESMRAKLQQVPGVELVVAMDWFGGEVKDSKRFFAQLAVDKDTVFRLYDDQTVSEATEKAWLERRDAAIVGWKLAEQMGWKVGDRVTILGRIWPVDPEFTIVGTYDGPDPTWFWFRKDYLEELLGNPGIVGTFWLRVDSPGSMARVAAAVDAMFADSFSPTKTETEFAFNLSFLEMLGNIRLLFTLLGGAAVFTILMVAGNTMAMAVRERATEIAVLKTLGFTKGLVVALVLLESVFVTLLGGVSGMIAAGGIAWAIRHVSTSGWFSQFYVQFAHGGIAIGASVALGLVAGAIPALRGASIRIADGLRKLD